MEIILLAIRSSWVGSPNPYSKISNSEDLVILWYCWFEYNFKYLEKLLPSFFKNVKEFSMQPCIPHKTYPSQSISLLNNSPSFVVTCGVYQGSTALLSLDGLFLPWMTIWVLTSIKPMDKRELLSLLGLFMKDK